MNLVPVQGLFQHRLQPLRALRQSLLQRQHRDRLRQAVPLRMLGTEMAIDENQTPGISQTVTVEEVGIDGIRIRSC